MGTYAAYHGAKFPTEAQVQTGIVFGPRGNDLTGSASLSGGLLDPVDLRNAMGLASANLDAQLAAIQASADGAIKAGDTITHSRPGRTSIQETITRP
jgi:hypothetical protein